MRSELIRGTKRDAQSALARLVTEVNDGGYASAGSLTIAQLLDRFLELKAHQVDPTTLTGYRRVADYYIVPRDRDDEGRQDSTASSRSLLLEPDCVWRKERQGALAPHGSTVPRSASSGPGPGQALGDAGHESGRGRHAAEGHPSRDHSPDVRTGGPLLKGAMEVDPDFGVYLRVLAVTGCRRGEGLALHWRDFRLGGKGLGRW